jgi:L-aminopeptidase/D-esterase-like protein
MLAYGFRMKGLTDIAGIKVGHATAREARTGVTAILCEAGAVAAVHVCGGATGTEELDTLGPHHITGHVHGIVLAGGSAFGLEAASGVRKWLAQKGAGFKTPAGPVPIVAAAILYDLGVARRGVRPNREMGEAAAGAASDRAVEEGAVGAGAGATVGKILGPACAMPGGVGSYTVTMGAVMVSALAVVNAFGDVIDPANGKIVAGARVHPTSQEFADTMRRLREGAAAAPFRPENTTLVVVATNTKLTKVEAGHVARMAQMGLARTIRPVFTPVDGDVIFALSAGREAADLIAVGSAAGDAVAEAVLRAVRR